MEASIEQKMTRINKVKKFLETKKVPSVMVLLTKKIITDYEYIKALCKMNAIYKGDDDLWHWDKRFKINKQSVEKLFEIASEFRKNRSNKSKSKNKKSKIKEASPDSTAPINDDVSILKDIQITLNNHILNDQHIGTVLSRLWAIMSAMQQDISIMSKSQNIEEVDEKNPNPES